MATYGPWLTAPDRVARFGYLGDFGVSLDVSKYRTSSSTASELNAQQESGFGTSITDTTASQPFAGHSYDGTTWTFRRAHLAFSIHSATDASYIPSPAPPRAFWEFEAPGLGAVVGDATVVITPIGYTGGATGTQFAFGFFQIGLGPSPVIDGTFNYGSVTAVTTTQTLTDIGGGLYPVAVDVWDTLQANGAATFGVEAGSVQVAGAVIATIRPPRFRAVYDTLPPLRQYPRDDFLGGAPRQGRQNGSTSTQRSARQGWANTYR